LIAEIVGYKGEIIWDASKPDGQLRKSLDTSDMEFYVSFEFTTLKDGLEKTIDYCKSLRK
jgi:GDP-L-fucose synthase